MTNHRHALTLLSVIGLASGCDQPRPRCSTATGDFAVRYEKILDIQGNCELTGDVLSLQAYFDPISSKDQSPDLGHTKIGVRPGALAGILAHAAERSATPDDKSVAIGTFATSKPGDDDYCRIATPLTARVQVPAIPQEIDMQCGDVIPAEPPVDEEYVFTEFDVYNTPGAYGTQLSAILNYRNPTCSATYRVVGIYPAIPCGTDPVVDEDASTPSDEAGVLDGGMDGGLDMDGTVPEAGPLDPDGSLVLPQEAPAEEEDPCAEPEPALPQIPDDGACGAGSGISPEFTATCDPVSLMCTIPFGKR